MRREEIIIGNKLIAEYMGWRLDNTFPDKDRVYRSPENSIELDTTFKFHSSWEWLMPVCKKIIDSYADMRQEIFSGLHNVDIEETYKGVVGFIKFWNDDTQVKLTWTNYPVKK